MQKTKQNSPTSNDAVLREWCLSWGFPTIVILAISLLAALSIGANFKQSTFATIIIFVICAVLLELIYYTCFQSIPLAIYNMYMRKKASEKIDTALPETDASADENEMVAQEDDAAEEAVSPTAAEVIPQIQDTPLSTTPIFDQAFYEQKRTEHLRQKEEERLAKVECIIEYTQMAWASLMTKEQIDLLCNEVRCWADDAAYKPEPVHTLPDADKLDAKHYVWNIAARLGGAHSGLECRSPFIKRLFDDMFHDNDLSSMKNLKIKPNSGVIKLDEPKGDEYLFAYQKRKDED